MSIRQSKDLISTKMGSELVGLYYYILDKAKLTEANSKIFGYVPTIQNISFNPFIEMDDPTTDIIEADFDSSHFGYTGSGKVYRLNSISRYDKKIGEFDLQGYYNNFDIETESKLLMYPFRYFMLTDYINPPLLIKPQFLYQKNNKVELVFKVKIALSQSSKYCLYAENYKGDEYGNLEGIVNNNPLQYPVGSSAYASFIATQGNSYNATNNLALMENDKTLSQQTRSLNLDNTKNNVSAIGGVASSLMNLFNGNIGGTIGGLANTGVNWYFNQQSNNLNSSFNRENYEMKEYQIQTMALAKTSDLLNTPRAIKSVGNDATYNVAHGHYKVDLIVYGMNVQSEVRIREYFKRYGYKTNQYKIPNLKSRKYFNFIKFHDCNIDSSRIPHEDIEQLQSIFESGVTFWHIDNGAKVKQYSYDDGNKEV